ncbi:MAG: cytochrome c [Deltaproteobacteria bacterium]|nr:cytochrome c [Deltaproteobacteria bacterium]
MKTTLTLLLATFLAAVTVLAADRFPATRKLIRSQGCLACHRLEGKGGDGAAPLDEVGARLTPQQLREILEKGKNSPTEPYMPSFSHLLEQDLEHLVAFLAGLKPKP